jgi:phosphatidylglycerophosphatase A
MRERLIILLATGLGLGRLPFAPGTFGSVLGLWYWWLLTRLPGELTQWIAVVAGILFAVWCTGVAARLLGRHDPPQVVLDEIVAIPVAFALLSPASPVWQILVAFVLFRVFDVWKPLVIRDAQKLPGGLGIVMDDLLAAALACVATYGLSLAKNSLS